MSGLGKRTVVGVLWNFTEQLLRRGLSVGITLALAWFLVPEDYGLVGLTTVFIGLASQSMEAGLRESLIRKETVSEEELSSALYANMAVSVLLWLVLVVAAPFVASFYEEPALVPVLVAVGLIIPLVAFQSLPRVVLTRNIDFRAQLAATVPAAALSGGLAVAMAFLGAGVWALVAQRVSAAAITAGLLWRGSGWRPSKPFQWAALRPLLGFGVQVQLARISGIVANNAYLLVIGKLYAISVVGHYTFAIRVRELVLSQLVRSIQKVTYPALAQLQGDPQALREGYRGVIGVMSLAVGPALLGLVYFAPEAFAVGLDERWAPAAPMLQVFCLAGLTYPVHQVNLNVLKVSGRGDLFLRWALFERGLLAVALVSTAGIGVFAMLWGQVVVGLVTLVPYAYYSKRLIGYGFVAQLADVLPAYGLAAGALGLAKFVTAGWEPLPALLVGPAAGVILYAAACWGLRVPGSQRVVGLAGRLLRRFRR